MELGLYFIALLFIDGVEIMANSRRVARVAALIKREVSQMLFGEIKDDRVGAGMVSITDVEVSLYSQRVR